MIHVESIYCLFYLLTFNGFRPISNFQGSVSVQYLRYHCFRRDPFVLTFKKVKCSLYFSVYVAIPLH